MTRLNKFFALMTLFLTGAAAFALPALADQPVNWQLGFQEPATPVAERINDFHTMLLYIITAITVFVMALMLVVFIRFNKRANPTPSTTTHHVPLEIAWTVIPVLILIVIVIPSMKLLYYADRTAEPEMTLKVTGYQWYWGYEYPDHDNLTFMSYPIADEDINTDENQVRLLSTDNPVVVPINTNIQVLVTAADVLHSWAVPAFGVKTDSVPGRTNETWMRITKPGVYYGQCSELCGQGHAFMPIEVHAVTKEEFQQWLLTAKEEFASNSLFNSPMNFASLENYR
jgi:cytochrome c oxidase subunit 2